MILNSNLRPVMEDLYESVLNIVQNMDAFEIKRNIVKCSVPEFNDRGFFKTFKEKEFLDFKKITSDHEAKIMNLSSYKTAFTVLKKIIHEKSKSPERSHTFDVDTATKRSIFDFISSFLRELNLKNLKISVFEKNFDKFCKFISNELFDAFCFVTVRNFDSNKKLIQLPHNQVLRVRTAEEFNAILGIEKIDPLYKINPNFSKIKFIVSASIPKKELNENKIFNTFRCFLYALQIFHSGDVQFGGAYYRDSLDWDIKPFISFKNEPFLTRKKTYKLERGKYSSNNFMKFYSEFSEIVFTKGEYTFLKLPITRFSRTSENESEQDKIVDYITCLESLYSPGDQLISFKLSMRIALLLGQTPKQKILLKNFILGVYHVRSRIVHGNDPPPITIDGHELEFEKYLYHLENIVRNSIKFFLYLILEYGTKEQVYKNINDSIYDPSIQKKFLHISKKLKLPPFDILNL